ncbi:hypothetical protein AB0392_47765 [Nonomuraea angiospora]
MAGRPRGKALLAGAGAPAGVLVAGAIVFHLLTPSKATRSVSFTVCERYS